MRVEKKRRKRTLNQLDTPTQTQTMRRTNKDIVNEMYIYVHACMT